MTREQAGANVNCNVAMLSAYRDGELNNVERRVVEEHLASCASCRAILRQYEALAATVAVRIEAPPGLAATLANRLRRPSSNRPALWPALRLAAFATAAVVILAAIFALPAFWPGQGLPVAAAYPAPQATNVPLDTTIVVQFSQAVDRSAMAEAVRIDPPVPVEPAWDGNKLVLTPTQPLEQGKRYTVTIEAPGSGGTSKPTVITTFSTGGPPAGSTAAPTATAPGAVLRPSPVVTPTATVPAAADWQCSVSPVRGFGRLYAENPGLRRAIGCPVETERSLQMAEQSFRNGNMLWRGDTRTIYVLRSDGRWSSLKDDWYDGTPLPAVETPPAGSYAPQRGFGNVWRQMPGMREDLGWATQPERGFTGAGQRYEHGLMLWSDEQWITVLYEDGTWQRFPDTFTDSSPTPISPVATVPQPGASPTATGSLTPTLPPTPTADVILTPTNVSRITPVVPGSGTANCSTTVKRGFGDVYQGQASVRERLGCAVDVERGIPAAEEDFEGGTMYWRGDTRNIYVLDEGGTWVAYPDTFLEGEPESAGETPPAGLVEPVRGFGKIWRDNPNVRTSLGWAVEQEHGMQGAVQSFARGLMLWSDRKRIYVIYEDGTWERFEDTFVEGG